MKAKKVWVVLIKDVNDIIGVYDSRAKAWSAALQYVHCKIDKIDDLSTWEAGDRNYWEIKAGGTREICFEGFYVK